jgi:DNA-binding MarR family transcriptional regulator
MDLYDIPVYRVIWQTRRLFQRLASEFPAPALYPGLSAAQRAILEFLDRGDEQTVPEMARRRAVSRQHVQTLVNDLVERGWVTAVTNPAHRRSPLIRLTTEGRDVIGRVKASDAMSAQEIGRRFSAEDLQITERTLRALDEFLSSGEWQAFKSRLATRGEES